MESIESTGNHGLIRRQDCMLLIIDVQQRLSPSIYNFGPICENIVKLSRFADIIGLPVVLTEQINLGETVQEVTGALGDVSALKKIEFNCFGSKDIAGRLWASGRKTLLIAGIETHICVAQTAISGLGRFDVQVVADATSSRNPLDRDLAFERMKGLGVALTSTEMLIYELLEKAGTDEFKEALRLVK
ncbi:MAG: isochorismatase family protein [Desulfatiglandaceae bacterium]